MTDPIDDIKQWLDYFRANHILEQIEIAHDNQLILFANPKQFELCRQALCNVRPDMESTLRASKLVKENQMIIMDPSAIDSFLPHEWSFTDD